MFCIWVVQVQIFEILLYHALYFLIFIGCFYWFITANTDSPQSVEETNSSINAINEINNATNDDAIISIQYPKPLGYVSDFDKTLSDEEIDELDKMLYDYEQKSTNVIVIVSISENLTEDNFSEYALKLANNWAIGQADKNNGLLLIYSAKLRQVEFVSGIGTQKTLTDKILGKIIAEKILPDFKKGNFYIGLNNGVIVSPIPVNRGFHIKNKEAKAPKIPKAKRLPQFLLPYFFTFKAKLIEAIERNSNRKPM